MTADRGGDVVVTIIKKPKDLIIFGLKFKSYVADNGEKICIVANKPTHDYYRLAKLANWVTKAHRWTQLDQRPQRVSIYRWDGRKDKWVYKISGELPDLKLGKSICVRWHKRRKKSLPGKIIRCVNVDGVWNIQTDMGDYKIKNSYA